jgi:ribosome assembly protein RRB1
MSEKDHASIKQQKNESVAAHQVWRPNVDKLEEGEALEYDPSAYVMYHSFRTEWPCLSFDFLKDTLGDNRQRFPLTMFAVTGSQADRPEKNKITLLKLSDLHKTQTSGGDDSDSESDDDDNLDEDPTIEHINVPHHGGVNRIRSMPQSPGIVATMADTSQAHIYDLSAQLKSMLAKGPRAPPVTKPSFTFKGHKQEGFALDWSSCVTGRLATGDCAGRIHIWNAIGSAGSGSWDVSSAWTGHQGSVEDLQWSPSEGTVFASASSDRTVKIWDTRGKGGPQISIDAHTEDVNVISWSKSVGYLLASGSDDGSFKVWDLRSAGSGSKKDGKGPIISNSSPLAHFTYHKGPITSIEWAPHDESVIAVSSEDNQVTVWDLSVEADDDAAAQANIDANFPVADFPAQLLFIHQGQHNVKEVHFHPQIPGTIVTTAEDGLNVFKPAISVSSS